MTADAKVGLLLGLVFIVIIAFLVNGLPAFLQSASPEDVVINTITPPTGPDLVIDDPVMETVRQLGPQIEKRQTAAPQDVPPLNPQGVDPVEPVRPVASATGAEPVQIASASPSKVADPQVSGQNNVPAPETFGDPAAASGAVKPTPQAAAPKGRIHVIQTGDTLSSIAAKYYGKENGNRQSVLAKLYEVNSKVLTSRDKMRIGDKLIIPSLTDLVGEAAKKPEPSQTLLSKFSNVLERPGKEDQKQITEYVVKQGDSLWSIAQRTMGDGKRYKEIIQANRDKIKDADDLTTGMSLKIPK